MVDGRRLLELAAANDIWPPGCCIHKPGLFLYYEGIISGVDPPCVFFFFNERKTKRDWHESCWRTEPRRREENLHSADFI